MQPCWIVAHLASLLGFVWSATLPEATNNSLPFRSLFTSNPIKPISINVIPSTSDLLFVVPNRTTLQSELPLKQATDFLLPPLSDQLNINPNRSVVMLVPITRRQALLADSPTPPSSSEPTFLVSNDSSLLRNPFESKPYKSNDEVINTLIANIFGNFSLQSLPPAELLFGSKPTTNRTFANRLTTEDIFSIAPVERVNATDIPGLPLTPDLQPVEVPVNNFVDSDIRTISEFDSTDRQPQPPTPTTRTFSFGGRSRPRFEPKPTTKPDFIGNSLRTISQLQPLEPIRTTPPRVESTFRPKVKPLPPSQLPPEIEPLHPVIPQTQPLAQPAPPVSPKRISFLDQPIPQFNQPEVRPTISSNLLTSTVTESTPQLRPKVQPLPSPERTDFLNLITRTFPRFPETPRLEQPVPSGFLGTSFPQFLPTVRPPLSSSAREDLLNTIALTLPPSDPEIKSAVSPAPERENFLNRVSQTVSKAKPSSESTRRDFPVQRTVPQISVSFASQLGLQSFNLTNAGYVPEAILQPEQPSLDLTEVLEPKISDFERIQVSTIDKPPSGQSTTPTSALPVVTLDADFYASVTEAPPPATVAATTPLPVADPPIVGGNILNDKVKFSYYFHLGSHKRARKPTFGSRHSYRPESRPKLMLAEPIENFYNTELEMKPRESEPLPENPSEQSGWAGEDFRLHSDQYRKFPSEVDSESQSRNNRPVMRFKASRPPSRPDKWASKLSPSVDNLINIISLPNYKFYLGRKSAN